MYFTRSLLTTTLSLLMTIISLAEDSPLYNIPLRNIDGKATWFVCDYDGAYVELTQAIMDEQDNEATA